MEAIKTVIRLVNHRKELGEQLNHLEQMNAHVMRENKPVSKCSHIVFKSPYGSDACIHTNADSELTDKLVEAAIEHLKERIGEIDNMLEKVEERIQGATLKEDV